MKNRIAIVSQGHLGIGGAEKNILQIASFLGHMYDFEIIGPMRPEFEKAARRLSPAPRLVTIPRYAKLDVRAVALLRKSFRRRRIDLVHTQDVRARLLGHAAARLAGAHTAHTYHMTPLFYDTGPVRRAIDVRLERAFNKYATECSVFVSANVRQMYLDEGLVSEDRSEVIHNGIDAAPYSRLLSQKEQIAAELRSRYGLTVDTVVASTVGRLTRQKGIDYLLQAIERLFVRSKSVPFHLLVAGDGPERSALQALASSLEIDPHVTFAGSLDPENINRLLLGSDLFVLASRFECLPYAILEAMAAGLPCIVSDVGGNSELISHETHGLVFDSGDVCRLAAHLECLVSEANLRQSLGDASRVRVQRFSLEKMAEKTNGVYERLLDAAT